MTIFRSLFCLPQNLPGFPPTSVVSHSHSFNPGALPLIHFHVVFSWSSVLSQFLLSKLNFLPKWSLPFSLNNICMQYLKIISSLPCSRIFFSNGVGVLCAYSQLLNYWSPFPTSNLFLHPPSSYLPSGSITARPFHYAQHLGFILTVPSPSSIYLLHHLQALLYPKSFFIFHLLQSHRN